MKKLYAGIIFSLITLSQTACLNTQTSQNVANFGRDRVFPTPAKDYPGLKIYLEEYASAQNRQDSEKIFSMTYPKLIETEGGRQSFLDKLKASNGDAKEFSFLAGQPTQTISEEGKILAVIPVSMKQKVAEGWKFSRAVIVAVSENEGRNWTFADVSDQEKRKILFPAIADKLEIPEIKPPWVEK